MKRKNSFIFFFVFFVLHNNYSQENNAVFINFEHPSSLFPKTGIGYEGKINNYFSYLFMGSFLREAMRIADSSYGADVHIETDFLAYFRYYPLQTSLKKFFGDVGIGYRLLLLETEDRQTSNLFLIQTRTGWKFAINKFIIQPYIGYSNDFGKINYPKYYPRFDDNFLKYGFLIFGISLGLLF
jgi:hypothetical protein